MRVIIQRCDYVKLSIEGKLFSSIDKGLLVLLGVENGVEEKDIDWLVKKILNLRIFNDDNDKMNLSVEDINGDIMVVSQFTLFASTKKGNRPSYINSAPPAISEPIYNKFVDKISSLTKCNVQTGQFGAMMNIEFVNNGPVTIMIDTKLKE